MKCLDTDLLVAILRGAGEAQESLRRLDQEGGNSTTSINAFEVFYGAYRSERRVKNEESARRLLSRLEVLPLTLESARKAGEIAADLASKGQTIDFRDAMVGGIAVSSGLRLVTRNKKDFSRIPDLQLDSW